MEEVILFPRLVDREQLKKEADLLRNDVLSGKRTDKVLVDALRKELNQDSTYNAEWSLGSNEYISNIFDQMVLSDGVNLINSSVGTGKTTQFIETRQGESRAKKGYIVLVPLTSIRLSFNGDNDVFRTGICTWNQVNTILNHSNKEYFKDKTLVIDEVHGFYLDYGYKANVINRLVSSFPLFKSVIMMSGTAKPDDFSGIDFNNVYKVYKPSTATKVISTIIASNEMDLVVQQLNESNRKTIVLLNDKSQCEALDAMCSRTGLVVNADKKEDPLVNELYTGRSLNFDVLYGTYSIVEGLSIENELDEVDIIIIGNEHPARIEQVTNRFRNVSKLKNVTYYIPRNEQLEIPLFNRDRVVADAKLMCEQLQGIYEALQTDSAKKSLTTQYSKDITGSMVFFHNGVFGISYTGIDYLNSEHKTLEYKNDFNLLTNALKEYDFKVNPIQFVDGDAENNKVLKDVAKQLKEDAEDARIAMIDEYLADAMSDQIKPVEEATEAYTTLHEMVQRVVERGLVDEDFEKLVKGYREDEAFIAKAHSDAEYFATGNTIRELIIDKVNDKTKLSTNDIRDIADSVIDKVLTEFFLGNVDLMMKNTQWTKNVIPQGTGLTSSSGKGARNILERYITLEKGKAVRVNGISIKMSEIRHLSLTGLRFNPPTVQPVVMPVLAQAALKERFKSLFN